MQNEDKCYTSNLKSLKCLFSLPYCILTSNRYQKHFILGQTNLTQSHT